jgi:putative spermidine/putrescine transport system substrate-binding protein
LGIVQNWIDRRRTMKRQGILGMLAAVALVAAACGTGASPKPSLDMPSAIGDAEDELNLIIWAGYAERGEIDPAYDWVTPFETETGCKVNTTDMGSSAEGVQLMESGQYDGGSFSGNATDRLMASGTVDPVNVALLSNYANVFEGLKNKAHNSKDGVPYGVPHGRGPNLLAYNTEVTTRRRAGTRSGKAPHTPARSASTTRRSSSPTRPCTS